LTSPGRPRAHSTLRHDQNALGMFCHYLVDARYGWAQQCQDRFGTHPVQICHEWTPPPAPRRSRAGHQSGRSPAPSCRPSSTLQTTRSTAPAASAARPLSTPGHSRQAATPARPGAPHGPQQRPASPCRAPARRRARRSARPAPDWRREVERRRRELMADLRRRPLAGRPPRYQGWSGAKERGSARLPIRGPRSSVRVARASPEVSTHRANRRPIVLPSVPASSARQESPRS